MDANDSHHLRNVLRLKLKDPCLVTDANGRQASACVHAFLPNGQVELKLASEPELIHKNSYIIVAQAMPQRGIMDALVHKAGELGIATLIPMMTERTQVRIAKSALDRVMTRWSRIAREAAKQSGNPETFIEAPVELSEILIRHKNMRIYMAHPKAEPLDYRELTSAAANSKENIPSALILIGPEGGFSDQEIREARQAGANVFSLFTGVLKTDTAFAGIVSLFRYFLETGKTA